MEDEPSDELKLAFDAMEKLICRSCGRGIWYDRPQQTIYHAKPKCQGFIDMMKKLDDIDPKSQH